MSEPGADFRGQFLYDLPSNVNYEFCRIMDGLSDRDWTRFASEVLIDQTEVRLAERKERRTDPVMHHWGNRLGRVGDLLDLLERLELLRPRDVILRWASSVKPPPPPPLVSMSRFDPPPKKPLPSSTQVTYRMSSTDRGGGGICLPRPDPPPQSLKSNIHQPPQCPPVMAACGGVGCVGGSVGTGVMCWPYEELHAGTKGFSPVLQVGEGGFGVVYRASLRNTDYAVKRFKQDCGLDWALLRDSFQTEVDKLSKYRHPNIVDLLGVSEGGGSFCLIYSYMENRSLEDQLHNDQGGLSWSQRVSVVEGAAKALEFLHFPPKGQERLIHGDVKSSNILLDRHLEAKLADFGLARFAARNSSGQNSRAQTTTMGKTATVRGTLAYLPDEYVRNGELGTTIDVYSFGVVLLEVLTGRRALEKDRKSGRERYLRDIVDEVQDTEADWRKQLDQRLISAGGAGEPTGCMQMVALACNCLDKKKKKRPAMSEVVEKLQNIHCILRKTSSLRSSSSLPSSLQPPSRSFPRPPRSLDSCIGALSNQLSQMRPLEDTYLAPSSSSSHTPPHPLHSSPSSSSSSSSLPSSSSSFAGPCETDESRGFSQYDVRSQFSGPTGTQFKSNGTCSRSLSPSTRDHYHSQTGPPESQSKQPSVPTEDQYNFPPQSGVISRPETAGGAGPIQPRVCKVPECLSPGGSLQSSSPGPSVQLNPSKQHLLVKNALYEEGRIDTPELLSSENIYAERSSAESRGPEESDELEYLSSEHK
ncbi:interleukin-1 receptor-associated kinase 1-like isoform X3 [Sphaeramia orbicularis]|uniref:interleukin-1 receptor-associated kinase 1-like isoform X3 n=1 Tax=Sphaeramia orbicularis TaxID=375764 RepID=UPI00117C0EDA|nr:interleukin-1 receptor-associated kinase 1-like isoform X3 [Sphaeramia orbicularis]